MKEYFCNLNYTLANEDTTLEYGVLSDNTKRILSIAGSGSRVTPLFAKFPEEVYCVDLSKEQLYLTELRIESIRSLSHTQFLEFWGYPPHNNTNIAKREELFQLITLSKEAAEYWHSFFKNKNWISPLYVGNWEKFIRKISGYIQKLMKQRAIDFFEKNRPLPALRWKMILLLVANSTFFNAFLYKGRHPIKNISTSYFGYYSRMFKRMFDFKRPKENFMLQMTILGRIAYPEATLLEGQQDWYERIKQGIQKAKVSYINSNFIDTAKNYGPFDFVSLSDVPSYLSDQTEKKYREWLAEAMTPNAKFVERFYFRVPEAENTDLLEDVSEQYSDLIKSEKTQIYIVKIWNKR